MNACFRMKSSKGILNYRPRFKLKHLLICVSLLCILMGLHASAKHKHERAIAQLKAKGAYFLFNSGVIVFPESLNEVLRSRDQEDISNSSATLNKFGEFKSWLRGILQVHTYKEITLFPENNLGSEDFRLLVDIAGLKAIYCDGVWISFEDMVFLLENLGENTSLVISGEYLTDEYLTALSSPTNVGGITIGRSSLTSDGFAQLTQHYQSSQCIFGTCDQEDLRKHTIRMRYYKSLKQRNLASED